MREVPQVVDTPLQIGSTAAPFEQAEPPKHEVPPGTVRHVPWVPGSAQDWQAPAQAELQQKPPAQNPLLHWSLRVQATPLPAGGTHWPVALHAVPETQSASVVHEAAQTLELAQRYGAQLCNAPQVVETPSQIGSVATPFEQTEPPRQEVPPGTVRHVPWEPGSAQDWQAPVQAVLQQKPPAHNPLLH